MNKPNEQPLIMVVDDSSAVRQQFILDFQTAELSVIVFPDGESTLEHIHVVDHGISAAVLDYRLPGMDGLSLTRQMRAHPNWSDIPILMCSTTTDPATLRKAKAIGIDAWAVNPFQPRTFIETVHSLIAGNADESP